MSKGSQAGLRRVGAAEWTKLRTVPSTRWMVAGAVGLTVLLGVLICSSVDTSGAGPTCTPGASGCGDEDVVMNSLGGVYLGQLAVVALGVVAITSEYGSGTIRTTFAAEPRRRSVLIAKVAVVGAVAVVAGAVACVAAFVVGQPILHGNGFVPRNGYPVVSLADGPSLRAVLGTALYLGAIASLGLGIGAMVRRSGAAIATAAGLLYVPMIVGLLLPASVRGTVLRIAPMTAGLAVQRTVERVDSVPIGPWAGLGITAAWAAAALTVASVLIARRDV